MYEELRGDLAAWATHFHFNDETSLLLCKAADAIEDLSKMLDEETEINTALECNMPVWIPIESRPMDDEEYQYYCEHLEYEIPREDAVIYCCQLPEHGQEVLVCNKWGNIWIDTFDDDPDYGIGFETNGDMDGLVAWMLLPEPPESGEA